MPMLRLAIAFILALCLIAPAQAQTVHRRDAPAGVATPTGGTLAIDFPVAYRDAEMRADDPPAPPAVVRLLTGMNSDRVRFSASETPLARRRLGRIFLPRRTGQQHPVHAVIQFPETERAQAIAMRYDFFGSDKVIKP
jgi:hypothetical protein